MSCMRVRSSLDSVWSSILAQEESSSRERGEEGTTHAQSERQRKTTLVASIANIQYTSAFSEYEVGGTCMH